MDNDDPMTLADLFREFKLEYGIQDASAPAEPATAAPAPTAHPETVAPGSERSAAAPEKPAKQKRIWNQSAIRAFYSDKSKGKFRGREEYAAEIEAEIEAAAIEGRIR